MYYVMREYTTPCMSWKVMSKGFDMYEDAVMHMRGLSSLDSNERAQYFVVKRYA